MDALREHDPYAFLPFVEAPSPGSASSTDTLDTTFPVTDSPLTLKNASSWTYCGPLLSARQSKLPPSFHHWSSSTISHPSHFLAHLTPLLSFVYDFLLKAGIQHYWLTIRATKPTHEYDTPRWHVDDDFFAPDFGRLMSDAESNENKRKGWKLATALLGPQTLFQCDNASALRILRQTKAKERSTHQHECTSIRCLGCSTYADSVRQCLASSLESREIVSPGHGELVVFRLGDDEGAVHSEPRCDADRIFVNIVPGTEEQLRALMGRWGMEFPRAWRLGVPGVLGESDGRDLFGTGDEEDM